MDQATNLSKLNLDNLSMEDLGGLIQRAQSVLNKKEQARIKELRDQARSLAKSQGVTVEALLGFDKPATPKRGLRKRPVKAKKTGTRKPVLPKYRNPTNPSEAWSGRGQMPRWMRAKIEKGSKREDFLIK